MKLKKRDISKAKTELNMKRLFRRNQIIITTLAIMIAAAGYLNYAGKEDLGAGGAFEAGLTDISEEDLLAENQIAGTYPGDGQYQEIASLDQDAEDIDRLDGAGEVNTGTDPVAAADLAAGGTSQNLQNTEGGAQTENSDASQTGLDNPGEAVLTSGISVSDYIANVQLSREQVRAKNKEALMEIVNSPTIEEAAKQQAIQNMVALTEIAEKENAAETLLMAKGFSDPVVSISSDKVDVVVNASSITDPQRAQIEDIVKRKAEVGADQIVITLLNLAE
ncbi:MAG: SpoIIIAH-like family protein [Lachnospiraceae bacterium]|jgi:stage III sporulation protein AH|nr:SpoIIIAH-like family protein [Lachnospiraceae bacterium]